MYDVFLPLPEPDAGLLLMLTRICETSGLLEQSWPSPSRFTRGEAHTLERLKATPPSLIATSSITLMEIEFGLQLAPAHARKLAPIMQAVLQTMTILPWAIEDAKATAALRAALQKKGRPIGAYDALIAGCALARGLTLVSSNEREFRRIGGLQIENWRKSEA